MLSRCNLNNTRADKVTAQQWCIRLSLNGPKNASVRVMRILHNRRHKVSIHLDTSCIKENGRAVAFPGAVDLGCYSQHFDKYSDHIEPGATILPSRCNTGTSARTKLDITEHACQAFRAATPQSQLWIVQFCACSEIFGLGTAYAASGECGKPVTSPLQPRPILQAVRIFESPCETAHQMECNMAL